MIEELRLFFISRLCIMIAALSACQQEAENNSKDLNDFNIADEGEYLLTITDNSELERFELEFKSLSKRDLCISRGSWPTGKNNPHSGHRTGSMNFAGEYVYAIIDGKRNPLRVSNFGYSIYPDEMSDEEIERLSSMVVLPGESIKGVIPYTEFETPIDVNINEKRELVFGLSPSYCLQG